MQLMMDSGLRDLFLLWVTTSLEKTGTLSEEIILCENTQWLSFTAFQARMVAAATSNLCEAANASVQGHASEEKLISSAKQVAASTAQLLVACKVKADHDSEAMRRLQVLVLIAENPW